MDYLSSILYGSVHHIVVHFLLQRFLPCYFILCVHSWSWLVVCVVFFCVDSFSWLVIWVRVFRVHSSSVELHLCYVFNNSSILLVESCFFQFLSLVLFLLWYHCRSCCHLPLLLCRNFCNRHICPLVHILHLCFLDILLSFHLHINVHVPCSLLWCYCFHHSDIGMGLCIDHIHSHCYFPIPHI